MAGIIRYLLDEALDGENELREAVMKSFGRPKTLDEMKGALGKLPNTECEQVFQKLVEYKKYMGGGNFNIAAAYVQLVTLFYETIDVKNDTFRSQWLWASRLFNLDDDNDMIRDGIGMEVKL
jgi:hypothetical protein